MTTATGCRSSAIPSAGACRRVPVRGTVAGCTSSACSSRGHRAGDDRWPWAWDRAPVAHSTRPPSPGPPVRPTAPSAQLLLVHRDPGALHPPTHLRSTGPTEPSARPPGSEQPPRAIPPSARPQRSDRRDPRPPRHRAARSRAPHRGAGRCRTLAGRSPCSRADQGAADRSVSVKLTVPRARSAAGQRVPRDRASDRAVYARPRP
jgi:hypothetical protein